MAKHPLNPPRKRRTREHVLADLSANHVERIALTCGFAVERVMHDYGLDLAVFTFDEQGFLEGGVSWIQLKATDRLKKNRDGKAAFIRLEKRDVLAWMAEPNPVILVLYDGQSDRGYWLSIHEYFGKGQAFAKLHGKTATVPIPEENLLTERVLRMLARQKLNEGGQA